MDLRHDTAIIAFIGPIETYSDADDNPQNAEVITFLSRSIQQSSSPTVQNVVARAQEDFLNGIARPHGVARTWRLEDYHHWTQQYTERAARRLDNSQEQEENPGPWTPDATDYCVRLASTRIGGQHLDTIDPLGSSAVGQRSILMLPASPPSNIPVPAAAPSSQGSQALTQQFASLSLNNVPAHSPATAFNVDHLCWGVAALPRQYCISPSIDFILAAQGTALPIIAMVKCVLADSQLVGDHCLARLEEIPLDFTTTHIIAYLAGRLVVDRGHA